MEVTVGNTGLNEPSLCLFVYCIWNLELLKVLQYRNHNMLL